MQFKRSIGIIFGLIAFATLIFSAALIAVIDYRVTSKLDGVLWTVPAKLYSRPLELAESIEINKDNLIKELEMLSYQKVKRPEKSGQFSFSRDKLTIFL